MNEWPSGTVVTDIAEERAVEVTLPNGKTHVIPADEVCLAAQARWLETRSSGRNNTKRLNWQDGVLDNAEYLSSPGYYVQKVSGMQFVNLVTKILIILYGDSNCVRAGEWSVPPDPEYQSSGHGNQVTYAILDILFPIKTNILKFIFSYCQQAFLLLLHRG